MGEVWKEVRGFSGYQASSLGRVRSKRTVLKPLRRKDGHLTVCLNRSRVYVHKAVMLAFVGHREPGQVVLHLNHIPDDNRVENLRYGTVSENLRMDFAAGVRSHKGVRAPAAKLTEDDVRNIRSSLLSSADLAPIYKMTARNIRTIRAKRTWTEVREHDAGPFRPVHATKGETIMARTKKVLTPAEIKEAKKNLTEGLKKISAELKPYQVSVKEAIKAAEAATKAAAKAVKESEKAKAAAEAKLAKAEAAAAAGRSKLEAKLAALEPAASN